MDYRWILKPSFYTMNRDGKVDLIIIDRKKKPSMFWGENTSYSLTMPSLATSSSFVWTPDGFQPRETWNSTKIFSLHLSLFQAEMAACLDTVKMNAKRGIKNLALVKCLRRNRCFHQEMAITCIIRPARFILKKGRVLYHGLFLYTHSQFISIRFSKRFWWNLVDNTSNCSYFWFLPTVFIGHCPYKQS